MINIVVFIWHWEEDSFRGVDALAPELDAEIEKGADVGVHSCVAHDERPAAGAWFAPLGLLGFA